MDEALPISISEMSLLVSSLTKHGVLAGLLSLVLYGVWKLAHQVIDTVREVGNGIAAAMRQQADAMTKQAEATGMLSKDILLFGENVATIRREAHEQTILLQHLIKTVERKYDE